MSQMNSPVPITQNPEITIPNSMDMMPSQTTFRTLHVMVTSRAYIGLDQHMGSTLIGVINHLSANLVSLNCNYDLDEPRIRRETETMETAQVRVGIGIMVLREGQILLGRRQGCHGAGEYAWPGGHLEFGETIEECIAREIEEETGLVVHPVRPVSLSNVIKYGRHYIDIQYLVEYVSGIPQVREPDKVENWAWYSLEALPDPLFEFARRGLEGYRAGQGISYYSVKEP